jgi:Xaa-Pro aminopeptidase
MVKFIKWVKESVAICELEEADIPGKLVEFRSEQGEFMSASFNAIVAYMDNAALMHYSPVKGQSAKLEPKGMLLVDSGGQYLGGTTDITRTVALGEVPDEMKHDFTLVLRAHIALATTRFLYGSTGTYLDVIPRRVMWAEGMDYKCGTGHGIGYCLSVHEGPCRFRFAHSQSARLEVGMLMTNEPGVYKEGAWGIRTENTVKIVKDIKTADGQFLKFETISYCPIDLAAINADELSADERAWLNNYHAMVYEKLAPVLDQEHREWLRENTREVIQ